MNTFTKLLVNPLVESSPIIEGFDAAQPEGDLNMRPLEVSNRGNDSASGEILTVDLQSINRNPRKELFNKYFNEEERCIKVNKELFEDTKLKFPAIHKNLLDILGECNQPQNLKEQQFRITSYFVKNLEGFYKAEIEDLGLWDTAELNRKIGQCKQYIDEYIRTQTQIQIRAQSNFRLVNTTISSNHRPN